MFRINYVMSNTTESGIFNAINNYFQQYLSKKFEVFITETPVINSDIYHYHRPNLEKKLLNNSIVTVHHDLEDNDIWFDAENFIDRYREADLVVCLNQTQKDILKQKDITNTIIIPHGYNEKLFTKKNISQQKQNEKIKLGIISKRYGRRVKGEAYLLELLKRLDNSKFEFIFVGENRTEDHILALNFGFSSKVYEHLPYYMFNQIYHEIDFLLVLSRFEGGPANIPEAIATNTPVIGMGIGMIKDIINNEENGFILKGDISRDIEVFNRITLEKEYLLQKFQKNIISKPNIITWVEVVKKYEDLYLQIIKR